MAQLGGEELKASVLFQCSETVCFAVGEDDAEVLAPKRKLWKIHLGK
jgi:hypothetical protein